MKRRQCGLAGALLNCCGRISFLLLRAGLVARGLTRQRVMDLRVRTVVVSDTQKSASRRCEVRNHHEDLLITRSKLSDARMFSLLINTLSFAGPAARLPMRVGNKRLHSHRAPVGPNRAPTGLLQGPRRAVLGRVGPYRALQGPAGPYGAL